MLKEPVVLEKAAFKPIAVLLPPVVFVNKAPAPVAVLEEPVVLEAAAFQPTAVLLPAVVLAASA